MQKVWKIIRAIVSVVLLIAVGVPSLLYVLLSIDSVQNRIRQITSTELSHLLSARVDIGNLSIRPFNRVLLSDLSLCDSTGSDTIATVTRVSAGVELWRLIRTGEIVVDYALVDGLSLNVWRADSAAPLNIEPVLAHLRSDRPRERETPFELRINTVIVRRSSASYDVRSAAERGSNRFDPNHIRIEDLAVNAYIPRITNTVTRVDLDHLSARERCGFELRRLSTQLAIEDSLLNISGLNIDLNRSTFNFQPIIIRSCSRGMKQALAEHPLEIQTASDTRVYPADFAPFVPSLSDIPSGLDLSLNVWCNGDSVALRNLEVNSSDPGAPLSLNATGFVAGLDSIATARYRLERFRATFSGEAVAATMGTNISPKLIGILTAIPITNIEVQGAGRGKKGNADIEMRADSGLLTAAIGYNLRQYSSDIQANLTFDNFNAGMFAPQAQLGRATGTVHTDITLLPHRRHFAATGNARADFHRVQWHGYDYSNLSLRLDMPRANRCEATVSLDDPNASALVYAFYDNSGDTLHTLNATAALTGISLSALGLPDPKPGYRTGAKLIAQLSGNSVDEIEGTVDLTDMSWLDSHNHGLRIPRLSVEAQPNNSVPTIKVTSNLISGNISGHYSLPSLPAQLKAMAAQYMPALLPNGPDNVTHGDNCFDYDFTIGSTEDICNFFGINAAIVYPAEISGRIDSRNSRASLQLDAPYILQGDKIYTNTVVYASMDSSRNSSRVYLTTQSPTKKGPMILSGDLAVANNRLDTRLDWTIQRRIPINGTIDLSAELRGLAPAGSSWPVPVDATVTFNPGTVNFGDDTWNIRPANITTGANGIEISGFALDSHSQHIAAGGIVSNNPADTLTLDLRNVRLLPIFETLEIDKAMLSGSATGVFSASSLLTDERVLECPSLHVDSIGYNRCTIGDADILARWDREHSSFYLDADITGDTGLHSRISGHIFPIEGALDLNFQAQYVPVGFLRPFMEAFARDISGRASGHCRLFGTFKEIDLTGDVWGQDITMAVDFTNTAYTTSDSVHMRPGRILIPPAVMYDAEGHTATISGEVGHTFFKSPTYRFDVTQARNFLAYNGTPAQNPDWYGTIYGNGTASVYGEPGIVNIEADMGTGPNSTFTFVLTDRLDAAEYTFINFRDVTPDSLRVTETAVYSDVPAIVREIQTRLEQQETDEPSQYKMQLSVDITPAATLTLVMDAATGDEIKATGNGHMRLSYDSADEDLRIYGSYAVATGSYHFTLQDIIIKDFTLKEGSTVAFDGDPYAVRADLKAYYATTANLSDLDESFLQDREVARTKVPVHALMNVHGDIRQPDITFDLEFPTLTDDTYRKVRSIVSTADMMNRQIIYLLALNRFYTPDYMASTTKGSELFSVASSTLSSQLGSLLGKLADNWSIAPSLRSDQGDFSDLEVDVALSSRLLNNRLLFNGNFGYRDRALNSNQFVGDFDIEYLLNPRGSWRLKAYNRYNDANYYLRSAATTQGIGIVYRRDFDNFFSFLKRKKHKTPPADAPNDSVATDTTSVIQK